MKNKKVIISIILAVVVLSVAGGLYLRKADKPEIKVPQSPEEMIKLADSNEFKAMDEDAKRDVMRKSMQQQFDSTINEYFALPEKDRTAYLDEVIDKIGQMRDQWSKRRPNQDSDLQRPRRTPSAERMRERTESMDPERLAKMAEFMQAMQKRMEKRGIESGFEHSGRR